MYQNVNFVFGQHTTVETLADSDNDNLNSTTTLADNVILQMTSQEVEEILTKNRQKMIDMKNPSGMYQTIFTIRYQIIKFRLCKIAFFV